MQFCTGTPRDCIPAWDHLPKVLLVRTRQETKNFKLAKLRVFPETKTFQGFNNVLGCCTAKWKVGHIDFFFLKLLSTFLLLLSLRNTEKSQTFSVSLVAKRPSIVDLNPCLIMEPQVYVFCFSSEYFFNI